MIRFTGLAWLRIYRVFRPPSLALGRWRLSALSEKPWGRGPVFALTQSGIPRWRSARSELQPPGEEGTPSPPNLKMERYGPPPGSQELVIVVEEAFA